MKKLLLISLLSLFVASCSSRIVEPTPQPLETVADETVEEKFLTLYAVGDIQMGKAWPEALKKLPEAPGEIFENIQGLFAGADIVFGNLETVLADTGESKKCKVNAKTCYAFRVPTVYAEALQQTGFNLLSLNNNHVEDFGLEGLASSKAALQKQNIRYSSRYEAPTHFTQSGVNISFVAFSTGPGPYHVPDIDKAVASIEALNEQPNTDGNLIIVSFHAGAEGKDAQHVPKDTELYYREDRGNVYEFAHRLIDAGADIVLGHGPHVLRAMEVYKGRFIAYSLGNFSSWKSFNLSGPSGISAILKLKVNQDGEIFDARILPLTLEWPGFPRLDATRQAVKLINSLSEEDLGETVFDESGIIRNHYLAK